MSTLEHRISIAAEGGSASRYTPPLRRTRHRAGAAVALAAAWILAVSIASTARAQPVCSVTGPDSIFFDKRDYNRYVTGQFDIAVTVVNSGTSEIDSIVAFPRSNPRFTVVPPAAVLLAVRFAPGDTSRVSFTMIVNPRDVSGVDTIAVNITGKAGMRCECLLPIWVEKEYKPVNDIICPPAGSLAVVFIDSLNDYMPQPLAVPVTVINHGDAPSKRSRIIFVATPGVALADGQSSIIEAGTIAQNGGRVDIVFFLRIVPRASDTTVNLQFKAQGEGGLGDRIVDTLCTTPLLIPAARDVDFHIDCATAPNIRFEDGVYKPNPFPWTARIRNIGAAKAKNVRAVITIPPSLRLDSSSAAMQMTGDMDIGEERIVTWLLHAAPMQEADTGEICVRTLDEFNRTAVCCDTIILPAVRASKLGGACTVIPDSIFVDPSTGRFLPAQCAVRIDIVNSGTEGVDSVTAELLCSDPDMLIVPPPPSAVLLTPRLDPQGTATSTWNVAPQPNPAARDVEFTVHIRGADSEEILTRCSVFVAASLVPELSCTAEIDPADTLHFDATTLAYDPLTFRATVRNTGRIGARDVETSIVLPPGIGLVSGDSATRRYAAAALLPDSTWSVEWRLLPLPRRDGTLDTIRVEFRTGPLRTECSRSIFIIGIPPVTVLRIPGNVVERYGKEITQPVLIDNTDNKNINRIEIHIEYEADKLEFLRFETLNTMLESGWDVTSSVAFGRISLLAVSLDQPLAGQGNLVWMTFGVRFGLGDDILRSTVTLLKFDSTVSAVNRGSILVRYFNGLLLLSGDCLYPLEAGEKFVIENHPNPFNPTTVIRYTVPAVGHAELFILDAMGRRIRTLRTGPSDAGTFSTTFDASELPAGVYLAVLQAGAHRAMHLMTLMK